MSDGLMDPSTPTLASGAAPAASPTPPAADPAVPPAPAPQTFEQRRHAQEQASAAEAPPAGNDPQATAGTEAQKFKVGKFEVSEGEIAAMMDRQAQDDLRKATIPPAPQDYKLTLPENLTLPGEAQFRFDEAGSKATFDAAKAWAHSRGLSQSDFSEMMGIYASHVAQQEAALAAAARAEIAKAGTNAPQRVDAIGKWIRAEVGDADAKPILATIVTDAHLGFYERLQQRITSQGSASFSQSHRVPADNKTIPGYENMSFEQRRFAQDQLAQQRR